MGKRFSLLLLVVLGLFLCLFSILCYYSRLATDDFYFIWDVRNHGVISGVVSQYMEWCGRFTATFAMDLFYQLFDLQHGWYGILFFITLVKLFCGIYLNFRLLNRRFDLELPSSSLLLIAGCSTALIFFLSVDIGETWFWFCSYSSYLWSIIALIWGLYFMFEEKYPLLCGTASVICFFYVGGASELYSALFGLIYTIGLIRNYRRTKTFPLKYLLPYVALGIAFLVFLIAPGNYLRDGLFPERNALYAFWTTAKSFVKFGALYLPFHLHYILIFAMPFIIAGYHCRDAAASFSWTLKKYFLNTTFSFSLILFIFFYLTAFVMTETGPPRIWFFASFLLAIYCCALCFYLGLKFPFSTVQLKLMMYLSAYGGIFFMCWNVYHQVPIASAYSRGYDQRTEYLLEMNEQLPGDTLIRLDPLTPAGYLYSSEISPDTSHFTNKELRLGYDLKYHVALNR